LLLALVRHRQPCATRPPPGVTTSAATVPRSGRCLGNTSGAADEPITPDPMKELVTLSTPTWRNFYKLILCRFGLRSD
jgi:hypothetical protein